MTPPLCINEFELNRAADIIVEVILKAEKFVYDDKVREKTLINLEI